MNGLSEIFRRFGEGTDARMTVPASDDELKRLEETLGRAVPASLRSLLSEVGCGLYEGGHEIFGPMRVMIHDIELVPDLLTIRKRLALEVGLDPHLLPFHRSGATYHLIRMEGGDAGAVVSLPAGKTYPDLASFVEKVLFRAVRESR